MSRVRKKRPFFLLEILIGLALTSVLLTLLFTAYARSAKFSVRIESARVRLMERQKLIARLQDFFLSHHSGSLYTKRFPKEKKDSLVGIFDNGVDPDAAFGGPVLARIYLDEEKNLIFALWPLEKEGGSRPWRKEVLLTGVDDFEFHFLRKAGEGAIRPVNAQLAWHESCSQGGEKSPPLVRLFVKQGGDVLPFAFFTPESEPVPTYFEKGYRS